MFLIFVTFVLTTALYVGLGFLAFRRVSRHLQENPAGVAALTEHLLIPILGRKPESETNTGQ